MSKRNRTTKPFQAGSLIPDPDFPGYTSKQMEALMPFLQAAEDGGRRSVTGEVMTPTEFKAGLQIAVAATAVLAELGYDAIPAPTKKLLDWRFDRGVDKANGVEFSGPKAMYENCREAIMVQAHMWELNIRAAGIQTALQAIDMHENRHAA